MAFIRGLWTPRGDFKVAMAVPCPEHFCRAAATWPCTTKTGKDSSTVHVKRHEAYHAAKAR